MSLVYLGLPPKANQAVAPSLASKDIHLQRAAPSSLSPVITVRDIQPMHAVYLKFLNVYILAAMTGESKKLVEPYAPIGHRDVPPFIREPTIVWSYGAKLTTEGIDALKSRYHAEETMIKGKPGFLATLNHQEILQLLSETPSPIETTPSNNACMNIKGYKAYIGLHRFFDAVMKTNQYPYTENEDSVVEDANLFHQRTSLAPIQDDDDEDMDTTVTIGMSPNGSENG